MDSFPPDANTLEHQFMTVVNAKHALTFRQYAVLVDIGSCVELLGAKVKLYIKDQAVLSSAIDDTNHIKRKADEWKIDIPFHSLEHYPSLVSNCMPSFVERCPQVYEQVQPLTGKYKHFQTIAHEFMKDPAALIENRISKSPTLQR